MHKYAREAYDIGIRFIGGCCGFEPYHIRALSEEVGTCVLSLNSNSCAIADCSSTITSLPKKEISFHLPVKSMECGEKDLSNTPNHGLGQGKSNNYIQLFHFLQE